MMWWRFMFLAAGTSAGIRFLADAFKRPDGFSAVSDEQWFWLCVFLCVGWLVASLWALIRGFE